MKMFSWNKNYEFHQQKRPPAARGSPETTDEVSNVVIQPLNVLSCAFLFAGLTFAGYISQE